MPGLLRTARPARAIRPAMLSRKRRRS